METMEVMLRAVSYCLGLDKEDGPHQVCILLYCMGEDTEDILTSMTATADDRKEYQK